MSGRTIVEYFSEHEKYKCGYCGSADTNCSNGMWAHAMTVADYQALIDRGWRRSGCYVYKPNMQKTCCPQYTIKCNALEFKLSRSQKKVIKKVNKFLNTGVKPGPKDKDSSWENIDVETDIKEVIPNQDRLKVADLGSGEVDDSNLKPSKMKSKNNMVTMETGDSSSSKEAKTSSVQTKNKTHPANCDKTDASQVKKSPRPGEGADPNKPRCTKAKDRRRKLWQEKHPGAQPGKKANQEGKSLEDHLNDIVPNPAHNLELRLVQTNPQSAEFEGTFEASHAVYQAYQMTVHNDPPEKPSPSQFTRFLCKSPLKAEQRSGGFPAGFGSFHQQYILDGEIIAVGVIDILPHSVSSVYLYYNPEYDFLSLGVYSALRELAFVRHIQTMEPELKFYYMGFYIHSCPKMRYKGGYSPSYLACPETYAWFPISECTPKLDLQKYSRFSPPGQDDREKLSELSELLILFSRQALPYSVYRLLNPDADDEQEVREYGGLVGNTLAQRMLLYRS